MKEIVTIENEKAIVKLLSTGASIMSFCIKDMDIDIALGFDDVDMYLAKGNASMGKSVGRCANRIGNARFTLNGKEYKLLANNGPNCLHGGEVRFGDREWNIAERTQTKVVFSYDSADMESGFPGNLHVETIYELSGNELNVTYTGLSDADTIFNMTNHAYFNLDKMKTNILLHELKIPAERININDDNGMATEKTQEVKNTEYDFRTFKKIGDAIASEKSSIDNLDTNYIYESLDFKTLAVLKNDSLMLEVQSDLPDVQIYTGKSLDIEGKDGHYGMYAGIAIEPQFCPNAINYNSFMKPIIKANQKVSHSIKYIFSNL